MKEFQILLSDWKLHNLANLAYCFSDLEELIKDLELPVLNTTHVKSIFNYTLEMKRGVKDDLEVILDPDVEMR